jgi:hypothetical protein
MSTHALSAGVLPATDLGARRDGADARCNRNVAAALARHCARMPP